MDSQLAHKRSLLPRVRRAVVKIGSSLLSSTGGVDRERLERLVGEIHGLRSERREIVIVSSGAVAVGTARLGLKQRPRTIPAKQATAAVGQIGLMALYEACFAARGDIVAQVLLTHDDLANRRRHLNARHTLEELLRAGVVPVVNENDTVAVEEMRFNFGDNDNLSALVATLISADLLVILSDVAGLFTADPHGTDDAQLVPLVESADRTARPYAFGAAGPLGTGGMASKVRAAQKATDAGIPCVIADGLNAGVLPAVFDPAQPVGTLFLPRGDRLSQRKHWIAHTLRPGGAITVDEGAHHAIVRQGRSLLAKGIVSVHGTFGAGECVACLTPDGHEFGRGLVNYSAAELDKIKGLHSSAIEGVLGYKIANEVIHRDDLVVLD